MLIFRFQNKIPSFHGLEGSLPFFLVSPQKETFLGKPCTCKAKAVSPSGCAKSCDSHMHVQRQEVWTDLGFNPSFDMGEVISSRTLDFLTSITGVRDLILGT